MEVVVLYLQYNDPRHVKIVERGDKADSPVCRVRIHTA